MQSRKKRMPLKEGLWKTPCAEGERPVLLGSRCLRCEEIFFPKKDNGICSHCQSRDLEVVELSPRGKVYSYTVVMQRPPIYYKGPVPYAEGFVELPEGVRIQTLFTDCDFDDIKIGMEMEMVIDKLHEDEEGNEIMTYKFRPVKS